MVNIVNFADGYNVPPSTIARTQDKLGNFSGGNGISSIWGWA
jgi:hypothetical protein